MNVRREQQHLRNAYDVANIVASTRIAGRVTELIAELGVSEDGASSTAVAVIDRALPHQHHVTREDYMVIKGSLAVHVDDQIHELHEGEVLTIHPGQTHYAVGQAT